jgi:hypothetical protein
MASRKKKGKQRRSGRWLAGLVGLLGVVALMLWLGLRNPYSFLDSFHPTHVAIDPARLLPVNTTLPIAVARVSPPKTELLVFRVKDTSAVLKEMRHELTPEKGYRVRPEHREEGELWEFDLHGKADEGAVFASGVIASMQKQMYESGYLIGARPTTAPACIVVVSRRDSWLERQWLGLKKLLRVH